MSSHSLWFHIREWITLLTCKVKWCLLESSDRSAWSCGAHGRWWVQNKSNKLNLSGHADIILSHKIIAFCSDSVCHLLLSYWKNCLTSFIDILEYLLRFWFSYRNTPANPLKQIFDTEGGQSDALKALTVCVSESIVPPFQHKSEKCLAFRTAPGE